MKEKTCLIQDEPNQEVVSFFQRKIISQGGKFMTNREIILEKVSLVSGVAFFRKQ